MPTDHVIIARRPGRSRAEVHPPGGGTLDRGILATLGNHGTDYVR
jgi:hypothetical protein